MSKYEVRGKTSQISATSRLSFSMPDNRRKDIWYALEYTEVRDLPDVEDINLEEERKALWEDTQAELGKKFAETIENHRNQF